MRSPPDGSSDLHWNESRAAHPPGCRTDLVDGQDDRLA
jgi:hypothetical protein